MSGKKQRNFDWLIWLWFIFLAVFFTRPLILKMGNEVAGEIGDNIYFIWMIGWVKKALFDAMGGFPDLPIMEDYEFSLRMRKAGIPICQLPGRIITSGRRYEKRFPLLTMWQMFHLRCLYRKGMDIQEIARRYKDIR